MMLSHLLRYRPLRLSRADWVLLLMPPLFFLVYGVFHWMTGRHVAALGVASLLCCLLLADALFVNPPGKAR